MRLAFLPCSFENVKFESDRNGPKNSADRRSSDGISDPILRGPNLCNSHSNRSNRSTRAFPTSSSRYDELRDASRFK